MSLPIKDGHATESIQLFNRIMIEYRFHVDTLMPVLKASFLGWFCSGQPSLNSIVNSSNGIRITFHSKKWGVYRQIRTQVIGDLLFWATSTTQSTFPSSSPKRFANNVFRLSKLACRNVSAAIIAIRGISINVEIHVT